MKGERSMITIPASTLEKIKNLSEEQFSILTAIINEFSNSKDSKETDNIDISKRIGIAKGKFKVPADFDEMDFDTLKLFGAEE